MNARTILCFGDSLAWGTIPGSLDLKSGLWRRYERHQRWAGVLQEELGPSYHVIEEAINGRTTTLDQITPERPYKNGLSLLPPALESHYPIDVVVFMIGTNDTRVQYHRSVQEIAEGMRQLIKVVQTSDKGARGNPPNILVIAPQPLLQIPNLPSIFDASSVKKSEHLGREYLRLTKEESCKFLNAADFLTSSPIDGVHLDEHNCAILGRQIAKMIGEMAKSLSNF